MTGQIILIHQKQALLINANDNKIAVYHKLKTFEEMLYLSLETKNVLEGRSKSQNKIAQRIFFKYVVDINHLQLFYFVDLSEHK